MNASSGPKFIRTKDRVTKRSKPTTTFQSTRTSTSASTNATSQDSSLLPSRDVDSNTNSPTGDVGFDDYVHDIVNDDYEDENETVLQALNHAKDDGNTDNLSNSLKEGSDFIHNFDANNIHISTKNQKRDKKLKSQTRTNSVISCIHDYNDDDIDMNMNMNMNSIQGKKIKYSNHHDDDSNNNNQSHLYNNRIENFIDDKDINEWHGPTQIRQSYNNHKSTITPKHYNPAQDLFLSTILQQSSSLHNYNHYYHDNCSSIGKQLLQRLGWTMRPKTNHSSSLSKYKDKTADNDNNNNNQVSYAFVPIDDNHEHQNQNYYNSNTHSIPNTTTDKDFDLLNHHLSQKQLKRITLQLNHHNASTPLPPPKIDVYGLGYQPYSNAPEFKKYHQDRLSKLQLKQQRIHRMKLHKHKNHDDDDDDDDDDDNDGVYGNQIDHNIIPNQTDEDFIGSKTVSGFALHDEDDDVYDDDDHADDCYTVQNLLRKVDSKSNSDGNRIQRGQKKDKDAFDSTKYNFEILDFSDNDDNDNSHDNIGIPYDKNNHLTKGSHIHENYPNNESDRKNNKNKLHSFASALDSWANLDPNVSANSTSDKARGTQTTNPIITTTTTSDGMPPLTGFIVGGEDIQSMKRYKGPDLPPNYEPQRHVFRQSATNNDVDNNPMEALKELSTLMKWEMNMKRKRIKDASRFSDQFQKKGIEHRKPLLTTGNSTFSGVSKTLNDRFTTSVSSSQTVSDHVKVKPLDSNVQSSLTSHSTSTTKPTPTVNMTRYVVPWTPNSLLCKRFHVNRANYISPTTDKQSTTTQSQQPQQPQQQKDTLKSKEELYFQNHILSQVSNENSFNQPVPFDPDDDDESRMFDTNDGTNELERPPSEVMREIFISDEEDGDDDDDKIAEEVIQEPSHDFERGISTNKRDNEDLNKAIIKREQICHDAEKNKEDSSRMKESIDGNNSDEGISSESDSSSYSKSSRRKKRKRNYDDTSGNKRRKRKRRKEKKSKRRSESKSSRKKRHDD